MSEARVSGISVLDHSTFSEAMKRAVSYERIPLEGAAQRLSAACGTSSKELMARLRERVPALLDTHGRCQLPALSWSDVAKFLSHRRLAWPRVRLLREGAHVPPGEFLATDRSSAEGAVMRLLGPEIVDYLRSGATLVVDSLEEGIEELADLVWDASAVLGEACSANAYLSYQGVSGFASHWDDHDVIVYQLSGSKEWSVWAPTLPAPMAGDHPRKPEGQPDHIFELTAGNVLYCPRGWWHVVQPTSDQSLHLTLSVPYRTIADGLRWMADALHLHDARFGQDLRVNTLEDIASAALPSGPGLHGMLNDYLLWHDARARPMAWLNDPAMTVDGLRKSVVRAAWCRPVVVCREDDGSTVTILTCERVIVANYETADLMRRVSSRHWRPVNEVAETEGEVDVFETLAVEGIVQLDC